MATEDRRVRRTRQSLHRALMELIVEKGYDKTTVQDIIDRADVGRSTFYAHYETKADLLLAGLDHFNSDLYQQMAGDPSVDAILPCLGAFDHVSQNYDLFNAMIGSRGIELVQRTALNVLTEAAIANIEKLAAAGETSDAPPEVRAAFVAGSLMALIKWWLDNAMPYPADDMARMYTEMVAAA